MSIDAQAEKLRAHFNSGFTRDLAYRKEQLRRFSRVLHKYERQIYDALQADLKKGIEESWVTEIGLLQSEIRYLQKNLDGWAGPRKVPTNLVNLPSSSEIRPEPLGLVLIIGPWNYPFQLLLMPMVAAIAAGNAVILKAPELCPASTALMKVIIEESFDPSLLMYVDGDGRKLVPELIEKARPNHIFFTGSTVVGRIIYQQAADKLIPVTLELGGKSPAVVCPDADIKTTARRIVLTKFSNAGQMCVAPDYVLVHESVHDRLLEEMKKCISAFYGPDPKNCDDYGRIVNRAHIDRLVGFLPEVEVLHGGDYLTDELYFGPTLVRPSNPEAAIMAEEIFGPILPVLPYSDKQDALSIINRNPDPLAFYVFSGNRREADWWLDAVPSGGACVNNASWHLTNHHLPFGGRGTSGLGTYHGRYGFDRFSHLKAVMRTPSWFDPFIKYPPFKGRLRLFKWLVR